MSNARAIRLQEPGIEQRASAHMSHTHTHTSIKELFTSLSIDRDTSYYL